MRRLQLTASDRSGVNAIRRDQLSDRKVLVSAGVATADAPWVGIRVPVGPVQAVGSPSGWKTW